MPVLGSQAVGLGFESLSCKILLRFILNIFWYPKLVKHWWVPSRSFSALLDKKFSTENCDTPIMHKIFRYPKFSETLKRCPRNCSALWDQKFLTEKRDIPPPFSSIKLFETRNFLKNSRIPLRNFPVLWDKKFRRKIVIGPLLSIIFFRYQKFSEKQKGSFAKIFVRLLWEKTVMSRHFDSVNTGELSTSEYNQWMTGILQYMKCKQKRRRYLKHRKLWRKINLLS